jgi:uncharacterized SAM-binding protein YcdF (DUF218 family)
MTAGTARQEVVMKMMRLSGIFVFAALLLFVVAGCTPLAYLYASPLMEDVKPARSDAIVLMSSGQFTDVWLTPDGTQRFAGALRLYRNGFAPWLITSGSNLAQGRDQATSEAEWLAMAGVPREKIIIENLSSRTYESVRALQNIMAERHFSSLTVVTSEMDVPRIRLAARKLGLTLTYYAVQEFPQPKGWIYFPAGFSVLYHATYEYAGLALYRWNGWI